MLRARSHVVSSFTRIFDDMDFIQAHTPIITSSDCEGAGEVFTVSAGSQSADGTQATSKGGSEPPEPFFQTPKYLTVSGQLHLEALSQSVGRVWTLSPAFRAERSDTARHLSEFYMLEAEEAFVDSLEPVMDLLETLLRGVTRQLQESRIGAELLDAHSHESKSAPSDSITAEQLSKRWNGLLQESWPRITYEQAIAYLLDDVHAGKVNFEITPSFEEGLQTEHERYLAEHVGRGGPVFVTNYPQAIKAFYMSPIGRSSEASGHAPLVACFDLLVPDICELAGGSLREHRLPELQRAMERQGIADSVQLNDATSPAAQESAPSNGHDLEWYTDLRRFGSVPHGGFGLGFDRLLAYLTGVSSVRDVVSFPRWYGRCDC
jgi:asparaginyl-tRNA synthetase